MSLKGHKIKFLSLLPSSGPNPDQKNDERTVSSQSSFTQLVKSSWTIGSRNRSSSPTDSRQKSNSSSSTSMSSDASLGHLSMTSNHSLKDQKSSSRLSSPNHHSSIVSAIRAIPSSSTTSLRSITSSNSHKHRPTRSAMSINISSSIPSSHPVRESSSASLKQDIRHQLSKTSLSNHQPQSPTSLLYPLSPRFPLKLNEPISTVSRQPSKQEIQHSGIMSHHRRLSINSLQQKTHSTSSSLRSPPLTAISDTQHQPNQQILQPPATISVSDLRRSSTSPSTPLSRPPPPVHQTSRSVPSSPISAPVIETNKVTISNDPVSGRKFLNKYEIIRELGRGQHGKVKLAVDTETNEQVAIKMVDRLGKPRLGRSIVAQSQEDKVRQEIAIMKKCHHPNVVRLIEVLDDSSKKIYIVLEYLEKGEIHWQDNDANPVLTLDEARDTARDVVSGLEYLHFQGIVHRDIKPANLLRDKTGTVKISDFGVSYASNVDGETNDELELAKTAGTPAFFAPELCTTTAPNGGPRPPITNKIDIWAFGVTLFCLVFGKLPFSAENEYELFDVISRERLVFPDEVPIFPVPRGKKSHHSMFYNVNDDLVEESLDHHVKKESPPAKNEETAPVPLVSPDPKLDSVKDLLRKLLERDPTKRIDIEGIKHHPWMMQGMDNNSLQNFLTATADDQRIIVTNEEVRTAVLGLGTRIKRRLSRLGSSALQFAGFRRKNSSSSTSSAAQSSSTSRSQSRDDSTGPLTYSDATGLTSKPSSRSPRKVSQSETARKNKKYFDQAVFSSYSGHDSDFSNTSSSRVPSSQFHTHNNTSQGAYDCNPLIDRATSNNKSANSSYSSLSSISSYQSSNPQTLWHPNTRDRTASALARNLNQNRDTAASGGICTSSVLMTNAASQLSYTSSHSASGAGIFPLSGRHISYSGPSSAPQHFIVEGQQRLSNDSCNSPVTPMAESSNNSLFLNDMSSSITSASTGSDYCTPPSRPRLHSDTPSFSAFRGGSESVCSLNTTSPHSSSSGYESGDGNFSNPENKRNSGASLEDAVGSFPGDGLGRSIYRFGLSTSANNYNLHSIIAGHSAHGIIDEDNEIDPKDTARKVLPSNVSTNSTIESSHRPSSQKSDNKQSPSKALPHPPSLTGLATACPSPSVCPLLGVEPIADANAYSLNSVGPGVAAEMCDLDSATLETKPGPNACGSWRDRSKAGGIVNPRSRPSPNQLQTAVGSDICSYGANQNGDTCDPSLNACANKKQFGEDCVSQKRSVSTTSPLCRGTAGLNSCVPKERAASYGPTQSALDVFSRFIVDDDDDDDDDDSSDQEGGFTLTVGPKPGMISQSASPRLAGQSDKRASISVAVASRLASPKNSNEHSKPRVNSVPLVAADSTTNKTQSSLCGDKARDSAGAADLESVPLPDLLAREMEALATKEKSLKSSVYDARLATKQPGSTSFSQQPEPTIPKPGPAPPVSVPSQYAYLAQRGPSKNGLQSTDFAKPTGITKQSLGYGSKMEVTEDDSSDDSSEDEGFFIRPRPIIKYA